MFKKICVVVLLVLCMTQTVWATESGVTITPDTQTYTSDGMIVPITISFSDMGLYNEEVYFSYHVLAEDGSILRYENERIPLSLENGVARLEVYIPCASFPELEAVELARIQFDLVDQRNVYWFSDRGYLEASGEYVQFERENLITEALQGENETSEVRDERISQTQMQTGKSQIASILLNAVAWFAVAGGFIYWYRRKKDHKKSAGHNRILPLANSQGIIQEEPVMLNYSDRVISIVLVVISFCIPFIIYYQNILQQESIISGDGLVNFYSFSYLKNLLSTGEFLLWNPYLAGGMPQGIMVGSPGIYPLNWLTALLPILFQLPFYFGIHLAIGCGFLYNYLRKISCGQLVSTAASIMYVFTVHMGGARKEHVVLIVTALYLPVIFYFAERYLQERKLKWLFCCSATMALQFLGGFLQYVIYADIVVFFYLLISGIFRKIPIMQMLKHGVVWLLSYFGMIMGAVLGTVQFLLLLSENSGEKMTLEAFSSLSLHPIKLLMSIFPEIFGSNVWSGLITQGNYSSGMDIELLLGAAAICMILSSFFLWKKSFYCRFMTGTLIASLIYACLGQIPVLTKIAYHIPVLNMFRVPSRTLFLFTFAEIVLIALSFEALWKEKAHRTVLHYVNLTTVVGCAVVFILYGLDIIPYDERLSIASVFLVPCALFAVYLLVFYVGDFCNKKGVLSDKVAKIGVIGITVVTMIVQVMPYYTFAYSKPIESLIGMSDEFINEVGTGKIWTIDESCQEIVNNSAVVYPVQGLNSYTNFNLPYLYQYTASVTSAPMNYSGLYKGFLNVTDILRTKGDLISMMGVKYLLLSPEVNAEACTEVQVTGIESNLLSLENLPFSRESDYQLATCPVELDPNSYYLVDVTLTSEVEGESFYVDFAGAGYDNAEQEQWFQLKEGTNSYSALLFTGECEHVEDIQFRIVALSMDQIQITSVQLDKVSVSEKQLYNLKSTGDYNIYENLYVKELIYASEQVAPISEEEYTQLYIQTGKYDILNTSYLTAADKTYDFSHVQVEVKNIELHNNYATAQVTADGDCFVNFSQTYYPGWKAYVDDQETEVYMVNGIIQGIFVPAGTHTVKFCFVPTIFYIGLAISAFTILACVAYSIYEWKKYGRK